MMTANPEMTPDGFPVKAAIPAADMGAAMLMFGAAACALYERQHSGRGQRLHVPLLGAALALQTSQFVSIEREDAANREALKAVLAEARSSGLSYEELVRVRRDALARREALGAADPYRGTFSTKDGIIAYTCLNRRLRERLLELVGLVDPRDTGGRSYPWSEGGAATSAELAQLVADRLRSRTTGEWLRLMTAAGIPASPLQFIEELFEDPIALANALVAEHDHPSVGPIKMLGLPIHMSSTAPEAARPAPTLGQHSRDVLRWLGHSESAITDLAHAGIVGEPGPRT
jgi:crotonobetainyl-CoA:carnitine CoA-transferase CaiB-like acyl-CoA transferase